MSVVAEYYMYWDLIILTHSRTSVVEQQQLMAREETRMVLRRARDDASSYIDLSAEQASILQRTIDSGGPDPEAMFNFDDLALDSHAYRSAFRSLMRREFEERSRKKMVSPTKTDDKGEISDRAQSGPTTGEPAEHSDGLDLVSPLTAKEVEDRVHGNGPPLTFEESNDRSKGKERHSSRPIDVRSDTNSSLNVEGQPSRPLATPHSDMANTSIARDSLDNGSQSAEAHIFNQTHQQGSVADADPGIADEFSSWRYPIGVLKLSIKKASGLRKFSIFRKPSTYVRAVVSPAVASDSEQDRAMADVSMSLDSTSIIKDDTEPVYNAVRYAYLFHVNQKIRLEVMAARKVVPDYSLGVVVVELRDYILQDVKGGYLPHDKHDRRSASLQPGVGAQNSDPFVAGFLDYELAFYPCLHAVYLPNNHHGGVEVDAVSSQLGKHPQGTLGGSQSPESRTNEVQLTVSKALSMHEKGMVIFKMNIVDLLHGERLCIHVRAPGMHCLSKSTLKTSITVCFFPLTWLSDMEIGLHVPGPEGKTSPVRASLATLLLNPLSLLRSTFVSLLLFSPSYVQKMSNFKSLYAEHTYNKRTPVTPFCVSCPGFQVTGCLFFRTSSNTTGPTPKTIL